MSIAPTPEELAALFKNGMLANEMAHWFNLNDPTEIQAIQSRCAAMHNAGTFDLLQLIEGGSIQKLNGHEFFMAVDFICKILPELEATPSRMMACVEALVTHGGGDGAANQPNAAFRLWCAKNPHLAREIITAARAGDNLASRHLTFALEGADEIDEARRIALAYDDERRLSAITALSRIVDNDPVSRANTISTFSELLDRDNADILRGHLLRASAAILALDSEGATQATVTLIKRLVENAGEFTLHQAAQMLWAYREALNSEIISGLLKALKNLNPANKGTVNQLDISLSTLLDTGHDEAAITYVTELLSQPDKNFELENFDNFTRALVSGLPDRLSRVVVRWLLIGSPELCGGLSNAMHGRDLDGPPLHIRAEDLSISPQAQLFICRKAIGWFFLKPTTAASILVSVLRVCDGETTMEVQKLLVDPLLLNYSSVRKYLEGLSSDEVAKKPIAQALADNNAYLEALRGIPLIKELKPSEHHRRIEQLRMSDQMRDVHKQARSQSVLLRIVKQSVLLYGNSSLSFIKEANDELRPTEMDLKPYGISFEMPRMEVVDPVGLDYMLRVFRGERMIQ